MKPEQGSPEDGAQCRQQGSPDDLAQCPEPAAVRGDAQPSPAAHTVPDKARAKGTDSDARDNYAPPEALIDSFTRQYSRDVMERVCRYAARRLSGAQRVSAKDYAAQELAQDAIVDTLEGKALWDFGVVPLKRHLYNVVMRQTAANWERAKRRPHVSIDAATPDGQSPVRDEMEHAMRERLPDQRDAEYSLSVIDELFRRAKDDADVLALINAKLDDRTSRARVMSVTGLSEQRYRAARRRLNRIVEKLGNELHLIRKGNEQP